MQPSLEILPDLDALTTGLASALYGSERAAGQVTVVGREGNPYASSSRSEIVTCRLADGSERRLLCKYEDKNGQSWSDVAYEAEVYRHVLQPAAISTARFYGTYRERLNGRMWLFLEYLDGSVALEENLDTEGLILAARWLGHFHASMDTIVSSARMPFLKRFDLAFYRDYVRRTLLSCADRQHRFGWLRTLAERFEAFVGLRWLARPTVSHGDYAPYNLLVRNGMLYPIDWELAGMDLGELDLAFLIDGWSAEAQQECERAYQRARWPHNLPTDFQQTLGAARLCLYFYKLGGQPDWTTDAQSLWYCKQLRHAGERLGLI